MEEALLGVNLRGGRWDVFVEELKKVSYIAIPMVVVTVSQHLLRVVSMMMIGHLSELSLSGAAIATSLTNVTGFSLLFGMSSALETFCGQAYGAEEYRKLGIYTTGAIISLLLVCIPISVLWLFVDKFLILIGQDPLISIEAGKYSSWLIATLFPYAILQALVRYLQTQSLILPMLISSIAALCFHVPLCWALVFKLNLGSCGAAIAIGLSYWFNVLLLCLYVKYSSSCEKTHLCFTKEVLPSAKEFFHLAIPSASMVCLEWWTSEIVILLAGLLPKPQLETSVLSICLLISSLHYFIPFSIGAGARFAQILSAILCSFMHILPTSGHKYGLKRNILALCSTRISNELGAGNPEAARMSVLSVTVLGMAEAIVASIVLLCSCRVLGYAFSNQKEVVDYLRDMTPLLCLLIGTDCIQAVLSGVARGSGWQHLGAYVNLGSYYLVAIPVAILLCFFFHLKGKGLWIGLDAGSIMQSLLFSLITCLTDWQKQASIARERIFHSRATIACER